jgi:hypothetical protein
METLYIGTGNNPPNLSAFPRLMVKLSATTIYGLRPFSDSNLSTIGRGSHQANQKLGIFTKSFVGPFPRFFHGQENLADFCRFQNLARHLQTPLAWPTDGPTAGSRRLEMTFNLTSLQQLAVSLVGAVFAASLFVSAAVGPVGQFI